MVSPQLLSHSQNDEEARLKSRLTQELVGEISLPNEDQIVERGAAVFGIRVFAVEWFRRCYLAIVYL
eukprot:scaffold1597_cov181-Alexandrium_tamarense.AAC.7